LIRHGAGAGPHGARVAKTCCPVTPCADRGGSGDRMTSRWARPRLGHEDRGGTEAFHLMGWQP